MKKVLALLLLVALLLSSALPVLAEEKSEYWLTDEKQTITIFLSNNYQTDFNKTNLMYQQLEELTNVHVDWIIVSESDLETRKSLMWASNELPDVIYSITQDEVLSYSEQGALLPLDEYKEYMPNFYAAMNDGRNDGVEQMLTLDDGHIYALPSLGLATYTTGSAAFINQSWLTAVGKEMPTTVEELKEVLIAFRDGDPNGNGEKDEIPMTFDWAGWNFCREIYGWFGVHPELWIRDGVAYYGPYMDDYKVMVRYFADLYTEGLIDKEVFTQSSSTYSAKAKAEPSLYGVCDGWRKGVVLADHNYDDYVVLPPPYCAETEWSGAIRTHMGEGREWTFNKAVVTSTCKNPELVCRWLDLFYTPWWGSQVADGYIGTHIYQQENGQFAEVPEDQIPAQYASRDEWKWYTMANVGPYYKATEYCTDLSTNAKWAVEMDEQSRIYADYYINDVVPPSYQLPEEYDLMASYETDIVSYVKEMFALWVTGERDVDADWDSYIAELESLGVKEYIAAYQAYYDRIMK